MKLNNFPPVYYISLEESIDRRIKLEHNFCRYGISNYHSLISKRFSESQEIIRGSSESRMKSTTKGAVISHIKNIKKWIDSGESDIAVFFEDDISFVTVDNWNFNWSDFVENLPSDWEAMQLMWVRPGTIGVIEIRERFPDDWSATAFMLTREYGEKIVNEYYIDENNFNIELQEVEPTVESILFGLGKTYTFPLFIEDISLPTTFINSPEYQKEPHLIREGQGEFHINSSEHMRSWWNSVGKRKNVKKLLGHDKLFPTSFDWGGFNLDLISSFKYEFEVQNLYEKYCRVKDGDIVVDIGASVGSFTYSILNKNPSIVYCVEPSKDLFGSLVRNTTKFSKDTPIVYVNKAIGNDRNDVKVFSSENENIYGSNDDFDIITFSEFIRDYNIQKIDFLKLDCEGGEYDIFTEKNIDWILKNVKNMACEFHLTYPGCKDKFRMFRDEYLALFDNYMILTCPNQNIVPGFILDVTHQIFDTDFFNDYWGELMVYVRR
jgi:FkbM family methyltransferase